MYFSKYRCFGIYPLEILGFRGCARGRADCLQPVQQEVQARAALDEQHVVRGNEDRVERRQIGLVHGPVQGYPLGLLPQHIIGIER